MRITQWGEFGIHFSTYLAKKQADGVSAVGAAEIASVHGVQPEYAQQILQRLRRGGIVTSLRGPAGGYHLAKPAAEVTLRDVLIASEGSTFEIICDTKPVSPNCCSNGAQCVLGDLWHELREHLNSFLTQRTLADLSARITGESSMPGLVQLEREKAGAPATRRRTV